MTRLYLPLLLPLPATGIDGGSEYLLLRPKTCGRGATTSTPEISASGPQHYYCLFSISCQAPWRKGRMRGGFCTMSKYVLLLLLFTLTCAKKTVIEKSEGIFILNEKNYDKAVKEFDHLLVYFYAPWFVISLNSISLSHHQSFPTQSSSVSPSPLLW